MLNGLDPILIFIFYKSVAPGQTSNIPLANDLGLDRYRLPLPPVPIYLSETATGIYIDSEDKNLDIQTIVETLRTGAKPILTQKGIGNVTTIKMEANKNSLGVTLLSAMADLIFGKLTSQEYSVTYLHGAVTIFGGLLHNFQIAQTADTDKLLITLELIRDSGSSSSALEVPSPTTGLANLNGSGALTSGTLPAGGGSFTSSGASSVPIGSAP
jgi:hypothetical protein